MLLESGARESDKVKALYKACKDKDYGVVIRYLDEGVDPETKIEDFQDKSPKDLLDLHQNTELSQIFDDWKQNSLWNEKRQLLYPNSFKRKVYTLRNGTSRSFHSSVTPISLTKTKTYKPNFVITKTFKVFKKFAWKK